MNKKGRKTCLKKSCRIRVHHNEDFKVFWKLKEDSIHEGDNDMNLQSDMIQTAVIDFVIDDKREEVYLGRFQEIDDFITKEGRRPKSNSPNTKERKLGVFLINCQGKYNQDKNKCKELMKRYSSCKKAYEELLKKFPLMLSDEQRHLQRFQEIDDFITKEGRRPNTKGKDPKEKKLGQFLDWCNRNYNQDKEKCKGFMKNYSSCKKRYEDLMKKFPRTFESDEQRYLRQFREIDDFITNNKGKRPGSKSEDPKEKKLGLFLGRCYRNYNQDKEKCKEFMKIIRHVKKDTKT